MIQQIVSTLHEKPKYGSNFLNQVNIYKKKDSFNLNSNTDQSSEIWPLEPLPTQPARANKNFISAIVFMYAIGHAILDDENVKLTRLSSGDKLSAFIGGVYGPKGLPNFFTQQMSLFFEDLIRQGSALVLFDDILLMSNCEPHMLQIVEHFQDNAN